MGFKKFPHPPVDAAFLHWECPAEVPVYNSIAALRLPTPQSTTQPEPEMGLITSPGSLQRPCLHLTCLPALFPSPAPPLLCPHSLLPQPKAQMHYHLSLPFCYSLPLFLSLSLSLFFPLSFPDPISFSLSLSLSLSLKCTFHNNSDPGERDEHGSGFGEADVLTGTQARVNQTVTQIISERNKPTIKHVQGWGDN